MSKDLRSPSWAVLSVTGTPGDLMGEEDRVSPMVMEANGLFGGLPLPFVGLLELADGAGRSPAAPLVLAALPEALLSSSALYALFASPAGELDA